MTARRGIVVLTGMLISAASLWILLQAVDAGETVSVIGRTDLVPLMAIVGVVVVQVALRAWRWSYLLPTAHRIRFTRLVPPLLVGYLGNAVMPARLGEPMRAVVVARRERIGTTEALGSVLVERVIDVATLAPVAFLAAIVVRAPAWATQTVGIVAAFSIACAGVLATTGLQPVARLAERLGLERWSTLSDLVHRFVATLGGPSRRTALLTAAAISVGIWVLDATSFWLAGLAVGANTSYAGAMLISGVAVLGTAIPSAPGYVGTFELAGAGMAGALGVPPAEALAMAVIVHVMTLGPVALGGTASILFIGANLGEVVRAAETPRDA